MSGPGNGPTGGPRNGPAGRSGRGSRTTIRVDIETPVYVISIAAELSGMHPQTLRQYDRLGLVSPGRSVGGGRRYSARDVEQLREVQRLSQEEGMNLAGVRRVLDLENQVAALRERVAELQAEVERSRAAFAAAEAEFGSGLYRRTYLPAVVDSRGTAVVHWPAAPRPR